jgi:NADH-quinone oxidoreductase subunit M
MDFLQSNLLTLLVFSPLAAAALIALWPAEQTRTIRWLAFVFSLVPLGLALNMWMNFSTEAAGFQFVQQYNWYPAIGASYHIGVDGISLPMILLTTLLTPLAILISFSIADRVRTYMMLFLMLEAGMLGVFASLDFLLFFIFWELGLVPMYFLINQWGGPNRRYASLKFFLYTMGGSLGMLLSAQVLSTVLGTWDIPAWMARWPGYDQAILGIPAATVHTITFWAFFIAFAIKVPIWPFHTWLPDAHTEAPTGGSMVLAGVLLKLGAYGFLRLVLPVFPVQFHDNAYTVAVLAVLAIVMGALASFGVYDFKRLVAYSSVNHMGFVVLGIAVAAAAQGLGADYSQSAIAAVNGAVLQMFNHGLSSAAMFALVGVVYERTHTRDLKQYGGIWVIAPVYGAILVFASMSSLGLPGLNGFVSEFMVAAGSWPIMPGFVAISMFGLLMTGAYILKAIRMVLHGPVNPTWAGTPGMEINFREAIALAPLLVLMLLLGLWPMWLLQVINSAVSHLLMG